MALQRTSKHLAFLSSCALAALLAAAPLASQPARAETVSEMGQSDPTNWPQYHRTGAGWRYSPLDQINKGNIKNLKVAWIAQPGDITSGLQATPIEVDGVLYYIGPYNHVYALNGETGQIIWQYKPTLAPISNDSFYAATSRGVTVGRGKVFVGSLDGRFIALDQKTGKQVWSRQLIDQKNTYAAVFSSPPQLAGDVLFGGSTGGDQPTRGKVYAVNADTGEPVWTFDTIVHDPKSWPGTSGDTGGGAAWLPGTYDETTDTIYVGIGNASPDFWGADREGDNKYTSSLLALDPKTGKLKWARQEIPHDVWDYGAPYEALLLPTGDKSLVHLNKSGHVFVMNKDNGDLRNVWQLIDAQNTIKEINPKTGELIGRNEPSATETKLLCPWLLGGRSWNHGAYSPKTGLWYTNTMEACNTAIAKKDDPNTLKTVTALSLGAADLATVAPPGGKPLGRLVARDPATGAKKWSVDYPIPGLSSVLATGGGLVFNADVEGNIFGYDAETGKTLWQFNAGSGARGGIISYSIKGKQYIAVPTGLGSAAVGFMANAFPKVKELPAGAALVVFSVD